MPLDRPMFIVGPPRCGTSLLYRCLVSHPDVGYFNRANRKFLKHPRLAHFLTRIGLYGDSPRESSRIWNLFHSGPDASMDAAQATEEARAFYERFIEEVLRLRGAVRFAAKFPSHTVRVPWLDALFPGALFLHARRDWRAAVASTMVKRAADFPGEWFGVHAPGWREAAKAPPEMGAAWQYRVSQEILEEQARRLEGRFMSVWYEELCTGTAKVMEEVARFCGLRWDDAIRSALPKDIRPPSDKWKKTLTPEMIDRIRADNEAGEGLARTTGFEAAARMMTFLKR